VEDGRTREERAAGAKRTRGEKNGDEGGALETIESVRDIVIDRDATYVL
jgi:hypothetical protein